MAKKAYVAFDEGIVLNDEQRLQVDIVVHALKKELKNNFRILLFRQTKTHPIFAQVFIVSNQKSVELMGAKGPTFFTTLKNLESRALKNKPLCV